MPDSVDDALLERFRFAAEAHLLPMLPGSTIATATDTNFGTQAVSSVPGYLGLKLRSADRTKRHVLVERSRPFGPGDERLAKTFVTEFRRIEDAAIADSELRDAATSLIPQRMVVSVVAEDSHLSRSGRSVLAEQLRLLQAWGSQTYEGHPIAAGLAVSEAAPLRARLDMATYQLLPAAKVLGDGLEALVCFHSTGATCEFVELGEPAADGVDPSHHPTAFRRIAGWTAIGGRAASCLTRRGDVLVFAKGALRFARRRGLWLHGNHEGAQGTWTGIHLTDVRSAVYATALDASFSRTGAGIAVLRASERTSALSENTMDERSVRTIDQAGDLESHGKGRVLDMVVRGKKFQELPRETRRDLVAVDGATVLGHDGTILAAGAIVRISGGHAEGGGRLAATKALAKFGFAVKVSSDGEIRAYQGLSDEPAYVGL